jgi:hypothetical protein
MVVNQSAGKVKKFGLVTALTAAATLVGATYAMADGPMVAKSAPMAYAPPATAACGSVYDFFFTACPLSWYGVTVYGTVDLGASYMTHGAPFDKNFPTGVPYLIAGGGTNGTGRAAGFFLGPNGLSQSNVGVKIVEPIAPGGWSFVGQFELAFDPYSALLANAPQSLQNGIGTAQNQQLSPIDSSRWGWLNTNQYVGISNPLAGTLTFGRQNALETDGVGAYDPMGGSYAFSPIGFSGKAAGGGDTEDARWTTAIKYRVNIGDGRFSAMIQPIGLFAPGGSAAAGISAYNPNNGAASIGVGGDIKHSVPGVMSWDLIGTYERDAVNIGTKFVGATQINGWPGGALPFPGGAASGLNATLSNQLAGMALFKWSLGSWGNDPAPIVGKGPVAPSGPTGIPLTFYAGYELIQFSNPSDPQTGSIRDDGFTFNFASVTGAALSANGTGIVNNAFNSLCGKGGGCTNEIFQIVWVGAKYGITKNLDIISAYYHYIQNQYVVNGATAATSCQNSANLSQCAGWLDVASLVLDWRFLPKWDTYFGVMYSAEFGGIANGSIARNNVAATSGVRFRF